MFGFISKNKLVKEAIRIMDLEEVSKAYSSDDFMFRCGNANALNYLCSRLGINLTTIIRDRNRRDD